jgi:hypothetical protein
MNYKRLKQTELRNAICQTWRLGDSVKRKIWQHTAELVSQQLSARVRSPIQRQCDKEWGVNDL